MAFMVEANAAGADKCDTLLPYEQRLAILRERCRKLKREYFERFAMAILQSGDKQQL
jgi:hypothetical protein